MTLYKYTFHGNFGVFWVHIIQGSLTDEDQSTSMQICICAFYRKTQICNRFFVFFTLGKKRRVLFIAQNCAYFFVLLVPGWCCKLVKFEAEFSKAMKNGCSSFCEKEIVFCYSTLPFARSNWILPIRAKEESKISVLYFQLAGSVLWYYARLS